VEEMRTGRDEEVRRGSDHPYEGRQRAWEGGGGKTVEICRWDYDGRGGEGRGRRKIIKG
jgi:environmental stress-induced protein Ves